MSEYTILGIQILLVIVGYILGSKFYDWQKNRVNKKSVVE